MTGDERIGNKLRHGFTTGSCAAAAAKAAAFMLLCGKEKKEITIETPAGIPYHAKIHDISRKEREVSCAVKKDGGDDPDVTTGSFVYARVWMDGQPGKQEITQIIIDGGVGVGRVMRPGLDQPVGNAAINHIPREMITKEVAQICELADYHGALYVEISVPGGEELAQKTFNPRLGIEGGISILGTTGIVEPMSESALLETIRVELNQHKALGESMIAVSPGNYGLEYMKCTYGYDLEKSVKCSNFIGDTIDMAVEAGFKEMLLTGHIGKLIKVSGGIMNTHSKIGDCRMELLAAAALQEGVEAEKVCRMLDCVTTDEALDMIYGMKIFQNVMNRVMDKIMFHLKKRTVGKMRIECLMYSNGYGKLAASGGAEDVLKKLMGQR